MSQLVLSLAPALTLRRYTATSPQPRDRKARAGTHRMSEHLFTQLYRGQVSTSPVSAGAGAEESLLDGAVQDRHTGRVQAHPAPMAQTSSPSWGTHSFLSYLTPKVILQGRRQDLHPQLSKLHLREEKTAVTLARETSVFFIELGKVRHGVEEDLPKATESGPKRSKIFQFKVSISPMGKMRHRESHDLNKATQHSQWQREAEIKVPLMSTAKCSNLNPQRLRPQKQGDRMAF